MNVQSVVLIVSGLIGGVGMFLYGMTLMSNGLQKAAGDSLRKILEKLTSNRYIGALVGIVVTVLLQSSTATTVMVVGFVNAGLMSLLQALSVVLGANVGTTVTAQIIAFNVKAIALPAIGVGALFYVFSKKEKVREISEIILGFGLLFFGMTTMTTAVIPLQESQYVTEVFVKFSYYPILAVLLGTITTIILQSSAAVIAVTMALAQAGLVDYPTAVALVFGDNIGTTITANIAAIGGSKTAKQAAFGHFLFNAIGVCYMLIVFKPFLQLVEFITPGNPTDIVDGAHPYIARHIANAHTMFNVVNIIIFLPMLGLLAKLCERFIKTDEAQSYVYTQLSDVMANTPELAVSRAKVEVVKMSAITLNMLDATVIAIEKWDKKQMGRVGNFEKTLDGFERELLTFLDTVQKRNLSTKTTQLVDILRSVTLGMEEMGDKTKKIMRITKKMLDKKQQISETAKEELHVMFAEVISFAEKTFTAFVTGQSQPLVEVEMEDNIDKLHKTYRKNHIKRLNKGECEIELGISFVDILGYLEEIGDLIFNVAQVNFRNVVKQDQKE